MRILYVIHQFFPKHYTGSERVVLNLCRQMNKKGHYTTVLTYGITETDGFDCEEGNFWIKRYNYKNIPVVSIRHKNIPEDIGFTIFDSDTEGVIYEVIKDEFDIIHIVHPMRLGSILKLAKTKNIPVVLTLTDFWLMCPRGIAVTAKGELCSSSECGIKCISDCFGEAWSEKIMQRFDDSNEFFKYAKFCISPTYFLANLLEKAFGRNIDVVRHGIDYNDISPHQDLKQNKTEITFGYVGTVLPHKGVHIAIKAFSLVKSKHIKFKVYGNHFQEKEYYERLKELSKKDDRVELLGEFKEEELSHLMKEMDCMIVPSIWWENSPLTVLTSLAFKVPVITINLGGGEELVKNGINGFNFEIGNPESLADIINKIAENPNVLDEIRSNIIRPPRVEEEAFEYDEIYQKCLGS
jgi:glycosyltransferase involved in cell wall biosynthesis